MPVDRQIIISILDVGSHVNMYGEYVVGTDVDYRVWAGQQDLSTSRVLETGGTRGDSDRVFRVRWFNELARATIDQLKITDHATDTYTVTRFEEVTDRGQRRRWLDLECTRESL